jgi:shikimate dehydrogenase
MRLFGLIGFPLGHSFSQDYFAKKFIRDNIRDASYLNFELKYVEEFPDVLKKFETLEGVNVTIPYKQSIISCIDLLDPTAKQIGAVNCILIRRHENHISTKGFNTDAEGFRKSLVPLLESHHRKALILGTGGSSRAIASVLSGLGIDFLFVSRHPVDKFQITYSQVKIAMLQQYHLIINASPVGMFPAVDHFPPIPYEALTEKHLLYDLVYNPAVTKFLQFGKESKAQIKNGIEMLSLQAEQSWQIWNSPSEGFTGAIS